MPTPPASFLPPRTGPPRRSSLFAWLALLLVFLLLAWGVWWFFEWEIQRLQHQADPMPTGSAEGP